MKRLWCWVQGGPLIVLMLTVLLVVMVGMLADQQSAVAGPPLQEGPQDHTGQRCAECHLDYESACQSGVHAIAYERETFQAAWAEANNAPECLQCHTTEYRQHTGDYLDENVQCEACHGENRPNHPPAEFVVNRAVDACGDCHTVTFEEWRRGPHVFTDDMGTVACSTCHNPHGQTLRVEEINNLCLNCHEAAPNTYVHLTHNEVDFENVEVTCASCHMHDIPTDEVHAIPDHTMESKTDACVDCHEALSIQGNVPLLVDVDTALAEERDLLREQVSLLEETINRNAEEAVESGISYVQLAQGLIVGLGIGITITWVLVRRESNGNGKKKS